jgi:glycosyltransferase involved in cell wall biosynthesis
MRDSRKILFVLSNSTEIIGGHFISVITIANEMSRLGYEVGVLIERPPVDWPEMQNKGINWHFRKYGSTLFTQNLRRIPFTVSTVASNSYNIITACDIEAVVPALISAILFGIPFIQFQIGGPVFDIIPPDLPGIVVFSQELLEGYLSVYKINPDYVFMSTGRVDFDCFRSPALTSKNDMQFHDGAVKVLLISRLAGPKINAAKYLVDEVAAASKSYPIELRIIGSGEDASELVSYVEALDSSDGNNLDIQFLGNLRINGADLRQADLVVGQGRTVIEAIASGVPTALCGTDGYFGLIDMDSYNILKRTNFSGREVQKQGNLFVDINRLSEVKINIMHLYNAAFQDYDVSKGAQVTIKAIENICSCYDLKRSMRLSYLSQFVTYSSKRTASWCRRHLLRRNGQL